MSGESGARLARRAESQHAPPVEGVTLASLHAAKGLEWDAVFLVGLTDGTLPINHATTPEQVEEEKSVSRSYGKTKDNQPVTLYTLSNKNGMETSITNYGERHRNGEVISSAFVESVVNQVVSKRMVKKQQMRWAPKSAHLLLQVRARVLNDELAQVFQRWYPAFVAPTESAMTEDLAA